MTAILLLAVMFLAVWLARSASRGRKTESRLAQLTSRVYFLEEELKQSRAESKPAPIVREQTVAPAPATVILASVTEPPLEPPPLPIVAETPPPLPSPVAAPAALSFKKLLNLEEALGTNWLNKLGIIIFVIGIALFLAYELRELGPSGKVAVGYASSAVMLGVGILFERRQQWRVLARSAIAGGWSLAYFTTYAMYHVPAAHVISSEPADLALLLVVAAAMVTHTLRYQSQMVTGMAFLLAFTTINISRGDAYSLIAGAILAVALAAIAVRRHWFEMEMAGMAAAYLNHYLWLRPIIEPMHGHIHEFPGYTASALLLTGYWLIFRASYVVRRVDDKRQDLISTLAALLNPALFMSVMGYQSVHPERAFQFFIGVGAVEMVLAQLPITRRRRSAFVVLTTLGSCLLVAAFPYKFADARLSVCWLAEAEALLLAGVFLREIVFRRLGLLAALLVWMQMLGGDAAQALGERFYDLRLGGQPGLAFFFGLAAVVLYANAHWIPRRWPDLIGTDLERLCFRRLSHMAAILALIGAWIAWPGAWTAVAWAALGVALAFVGRRLQLREASIDGLACTAATILRVLFVNFGATHTYSFAPWMTERLLSLSLVIALLYLASRWAGVSGILGAERIAPAYTWAASALGGLLAWYELRPAGVALAWTMLGLVLLEAGLKRQSTHLRWQAYLAFAASFLRLFFVNLNAAGVPGEISPRVYTTAPLALAFYYVYSRLVGRSGDFLGAERRFKIAECHSFLGLLTFAALMRFELDVDLVVVAWAALVLGLAAIAWKTGRRIFLHQGLLLAFGVLFRASLHNLYQRSFFPAPFWHGRVLSVGATAALLFLVLPFAFSLRRLDVDGAPRKWFSRFMSALDRRPEQVFFFIPFVLLTALLALEVRIGMVTLAWGMEAVVVFLLALSVKERSYRLAGLGLLLVCVAKIVFRDVWGLAPRDRYLTFIVLGAALLGVSYLYTRYRGVLRQYL